MLNLQKNEKSSHITLDFFTIWWENRDNWNNVFAKNLGVLGQMVHELLNKIIFTH